MHITDQQRHTTTLQCPVCGGDFEQRKDGRPITCSRSCSRMRDWERRRREKPPRLRYVNSQGYVMIAAPADYEGKTYPNGYSKSPTQMVLEHRLVMARKLGRPLQAHESVHHKNGDRSDNRVENLELRVGRHGIGASASHCATCRCFEGV